MIVDIGVTFSCSYSSSKPAALWRTSVGADRRFLSAGSRSVFDSFHSLKRDQYLKLS